MPWDLGLLNQVRKEKKSVNFSCNIPVLNKLFAAKYHWRKLSALLAGPSSSTQFHDSCFPFAPIPFSINPGSVAFCQIHPELLTGVYVSLARTSSLKHVVHKYLCWLWEELWPRLFAAGFHKYPTHTSAAKSVSLTRAGTPFGMNSPKFTCHRDSPDSEWLSYHRERNRFSKGHSPMWQ